MKRLTLSTLILLAIAGFAAAQTTTQNVVKIEGKLALINGEIGIKVKDKTYYVSIPRRLFGFIDGLKEGAQVKLEGYEDADVKTPDYIHFRVTKLTLNGKDYDLSQYQGRGMMDGGGPDRMMDGKGYGRGNMNGGSYQPQGRGRGNR